MTTISEDQVRILAAQSAVALSDDQVAAFGANLGAILEYFNQLSELDVDDVPATYQVGELHNVMRDDVVIDYGVDQASLLHNVPTTDGTSIKVPKVL